MKRILNYPGSKWSLANVIIDNIPPHTTYVEPFFGSGAVFFLKEKSKVETINDLNSRVYNFFKVCRNQPEELAKLVYLTPMSREEQRLSNLPAEEPLEQARRFVVQSWQSIGGIQRHKTGWRSNIDKVGGKLNEWNDIPDRILEVANRLKDAQIENQDAAKILQRYNRKEVFAYVDPPYIQSTRKGRFYETELEDLEQPELLNTLIDFKGKVILSGYENNLYNEMLQDWSKIYIDSNAEAGQRRLEVLWMNFEPNGQLSLLD